MCCVLEDESEAYNKEECLKEIPCTFYIIIVKYYWGFFFH